MAGSSSSAAAASEAISSSLVCRSRASGYSSRFLVTPQSLPPGWRQERKGAMYTTWYDDKGNRYKSSTEVERALRERALLTSEDETGMETGGETSEFEPSPVKRSRREL